MQTADLLRALASECRASHTAALFVIGWFAANATQQELEGCLAAVHEAGRFAADGGHLAAYAERWGRVPDVRP